MSLILSGTDGLSDVDGSAATPAIRGTDANTGMFFPAADTIAFSEGGVEAMRIDSSGRLLIGMTTGTRALSVQGIIGAYHSSNDSQFLLYNNGTISILNATYGSTGAYTPITFYTSDVERMRINAGAPILCLAGGNTSATGTGIAFPATQSASTDANTLDDYEEGTWTPTDGSGAGLTFSDVTARYTKVGRLVTVSVQLSYPITANGNNAQINGLPFAATVDSGLAIGYDHTAQVRNAYVTGSTIRPYATGSTRNTNANLTQSLSLTLAGSYIVA